MDASQNSVSDKGCGDDNFSRDNIKTQIENVQTTANTVPSPNALLMSDFNISYVSPRRQTVQMTPEMREKVKDRIKSHNLFKTLLDDDEDDEDVAYDDLFDNFLTDEDFQKIDEFDEDDLERGYKDDLLPLDKMHFFNLLSKSDKEQIIEKYNKDEET